MWFLIVLFILAYVSIALKFPKLVLWFLGAVAIMILVVQYLGYKESQDKSQILARLKVAQSCPALAMTISNNSSYDITDVEMIPIAKQEGFSRNLIKGYATYHSDRIIPAGMSETVCVDFPKLKESVDINSLVWRYEEVEINFKDSRTYFLEGERRF
ncbi:MAG TPA: hypothetical protein DHW71_15165 [Gammaproteobacteria bacterium]|nr:hypothetical protein [Gammaproteobacteria bacterium]HBF09862.1 hypothetical protein [Gammaproteobacteria bacterium]HCK94333.1 hypothetical protein [Gammaproteobacteria bacterium]|tara:strand:+ start:412 stop:882 length:471 start_codon:yes stop_codon:yes gene_type:complete